jgi:hypothetical protein
VSLGSGRLQGLVRTSVRHCQPSLLELNWCVFCILQQKAFFCFMFEVPGKIVQDFSGQRNSRSHIFEPRKFWAASRDVLRGDWFPKPSLTLFTFGLRCIKAESAVQPECPIRALSRPHKCRLVEGSERVASASTSAYRESVVGSFGKGACTINGENMSSLMSKNFLLREPGLGCRHKACQCANRLTSHLPQPHTASLQCRPYVESFHSKSFSQVTAVA